MSAVDYAQNKINSAERELTHERSLRAKRSVVKEAGEIIGKAMKKLSIVAHLQRARSILTSGAKFKRENRIYEKKGGLERANLDFHLMDVRNVEWYRSDNFGLVKKGTVGNGVVRFISPRGQEPQIILSKLTTAWQRTSTIHVKYIS